MSQSNLPIAYASQVASVAVDDSTVAAAAISTENGHAQCWACPACTLVNSFQIENCAACGQIQPLSIQEEMRWVDDANRKEQQMAMDGRSFECYNDHEISDDINADDFNVSVEEVHQEGNFEKKLRRKERRRHRMAAGAAVGAAVGIGAGIIGVGLGAAAAAAGVHVISKNREKKKDKKVAMEHALKDAFPSKNDL